MKKQVSYAFTYDRQIRNSNEESCDDRVAKKNYRDYFPVIIFQWFPDMRFPIKGGKDKNN